MKKKRNNKKIPAYAFGINELGTAMGDYAGIGSMFGSGLSGLSEEGSTGDIAGSTLGGVAKGASAGMVAGPIGAVAGGAVGLIGGLFSGFKRKKQLEELKARKQSMKNTKMGLANSAMAEQEYWADNNQAYTFENGGILPDLAYLDNEEIIRDDNGNIIQVPNTTQGTDQHLVDASSLESVLSDKIKRPSTGKTFAQEGKHLSNMTKPSKGKDMFAQNTDKLNKMNANLAYTRLLQEQESVKAMKGIKPKTKGIPAYEDGIRKRTLDEYNKGFLPFPPMPRLNTNYSLPKVEAPTPYTDSQIAEINRRRRPSDAPEDTKTGFGSINLRDAGNSLMSLAPTAYNFMQSLKSPEYEEAVANPYVGAINRSMSKRRMNIEPTMAANRRSRSIANYNLAKLSPNTGMNLAARTQLAAGEYAQNTDMYASRDNANNAYLGEYANMLNNMGQQFVQSQTMTNDINARNRAASRNYGATTSSQIGQWAQVQQQMANQRRNDEMVFPLLGNFLSYGQTSGTMQDIYNKFYNRR